jgi:hypothetical protein
MWLVLWLVLAAAIGMVVGQNSLRYYRLHRAGVAVQGVALETKPHLQILYRFEVRGRTYEGVGRTDMGRTDVGVTPLKPGEKVPVYYLPGTPEVNCLGDPHRLYSAEFPAALLASILFPSMIVGILAFRLAGRVRRW